MLRLLLSSVLVLGLATGTLAATAHFDVQGMVCESCAEDIKASLSTQVGIRSVAIDLVHARVTVNYDARKANPALIRKAIEAYGFDAKLIPNPPAKRPR